jgi:hypothetical protein
MAGEAIKLGWLGRAPQHVSGPPRRTAPDAVFNDVEIVPVC